MGKLSSQHIRIFTGIAALTLLLSAFQNCGMNTSLGQMKANNVTKAKGNGEGYGGKTTLYANASVACSNLENSKTSIIEQKGSDFYLIRENCQDITPVKLTEGTVDHQVHADNIALYDDRVFLEYAPTRDGESGGEIPSSGAGVRTIVSKKLCRGSTSSGYPRQTIDINVDLDTNFESKSYLTVANYSAANQVAGAAVSLSANATATVSAPSPQTTSTIYTGVGLAAGESYNLSIGQTDNGVTSFALKSKAGVLTSASNLALKCYDF